MRLLALSGALALALALGALWLVRASGSPQAVEPPSVAPAKARAGTPPLPPRGALVLARGHGDLAVAIAARRMPGGVRLTATVLAGDGTGLSGLRVRFAVDGAQLPPAKACGAGLLCLGRAREHCRQARGGRR